MSRRSMRGFTLLETIVIIAIAGIVGAILVNLMGTQLTQSALPIAWSQRDASAEEKMEQYVAQFVRETNDTSSNGAAVLAALFAQAGSDPDVSACYISFDAVTRAEDNTAWATPTDYLKITVQIGGEGQSLTTIFTNSRPDETSDAVVNF